MATPAKEALPVYREALINYLTSMARSVESNVNQALDALLYREHGGSADRAGQVFLLEPRINEMEIVIDDHAVRMLRGGALSDEEIRLVVATLKLTNDLERIGDLAVNIAERVVSLAEMRQAQAPEELEPMIAAVRAMNQKALSALIFRNLELAREVLESDDVVDHYRDRLFEQLLIGMQVDPGLIAGNFQFVLATRYLERIADHATNIAEDVIYWVRGLDIRHGRALEGTPSSTPVTENS